MAQPYFKGNYGSALARVDTRPIMEAGRAQRQMYAGLGGQIGGMIKEYGLNKQKRDKAEAAFQGDFGRVMQDPEQLASMQADPVIGPTLKRIQEGKGKTSDFDKYNAYRASAKEAELEKLGLEQVKLQGIAQRLLNENRRMGNELDRDALGFRKGIIKGQADLARAAGDYAPLQQQVDLAGKKARLEATTQGIEQGKEMFPLQVEATTQDIQQGKEMFPLQLAATTQGIQQGKEMFPLQVENIKSQIRSRDLFSAKALYDSMGIGGPVPPDLEKRFTEIHGQLEKTNNSLIRVKADGGLFSDGPVTTVTYSEYKENPDDYVSADQSTSKRIQTLEARSDALIEEQTNVLLSTKVPATDEDGKTVMVTLEQKLAYDQAQAGSSDEQGGGSGQGSIIEAFLRKHNIGPGQKEQIIGILAQGAKSGVDVSLQNDTVAAFLDAHGIGKEDLNQVIDRLKSNIKTLVQ
jgi:hypothetical protein